MINTNNEFNNESSENGGNKVSQTKTTKSDKKASTSKKASLGKKRGRKPKPTKPEDLLPKKPKKRGRKPKQKKLDDLLPKKPKKRGRKPKPKKLDDLLPKIPKKRGRKPKDKYGIVPLSISNTSETENDNLILHLPISSKIINNKYDIQDTLLEYKPEITEPTGYDGGKLDECYEKFNIQCIDSNTCSDDDCKSAPNKIVDEILDLKVTQNPVITTTENIETTVIPKQINNTQNIRELKIKRREEFETYKIDNSLHHTLVQFYEANKTKQLPSSTNIVCFWCTESFNCKPVGLPFKYENNIFYIDGCFCSPECAAAYNFDISNNTDIWDRYSLLNLLYIKMLGNKKINIKLAPPRRTLKKFGGILSIGEFRKFNDNYYKQYDIIYPPMISVLPDIEKIDINKDLKKKYDYIPVDKDRIKKVSDNLILVRKKPINKFVNTLENCMSLRYVEI